MNQTMNIAMPKDKTEFDVLYNRYSELHKKLKDDHSPDERKKLIDEIVYIGKQFETGVYK